MKWIAGIPKLYIWKDSRLFLGSNFIPFRNYTLDWDQFLVSTQGDIFLTQDNGQKIATRSCLIRAGTLVNTPDIDTRNAILTIYYLNPISQDFAILDTVMARAHQGISYGHPKQDHMAKQLRYLHDAGLPSHLAYQLLREFFTRGKESIQLIHKFDSRIIAIVKKIRETIGDDISIHDYAELVNLSESRLVKLFKKQLGIPITKYRLQIRVSYGVIHLGAGRSVTDAALFSGFSSTAHFSNCYSDMIGIQPSSQFLKPPFIKAYIADEVLNSLPTNV